MLSNHVIFVTKMRNAGWKGKQQHHHPKSHKPHSIHRPTGEWLYGAQPVRAALESKRRDHFFNLYIRDSHFDTRHPLSMSLMDTWRQLMGKEAILVDKEFLGNILQDKLHQVRIVFFCLICQGIVLDASPLEMRPIDFLPPPEREDQLWVLLHEIQDPQNLGGILRSCLFFGVDGVVISYLIF